MEANLSIWKQVSACGSKSHGNALGRDLVTKSQAFASPGMVTLLSGDVKVEDGVLVQDQRLVDGEMQVAVGPVDEENWTE